MNNGNLSEKEIIKALNDTQFFSSLPPYHKLQVMIIDIIKNQSIKKSNFQCWQDCNDENQGIKDEERIDEILKILQLKNPSKTLSILYSTGLLEFCLHYCFPIKKKLSLRDFNTIIKRMDLCKGEIAVKLGILLFPFDVDNVAKILENANFAEDVIHIITKSLKHIEDFTLIKQGQQLKQFVYKHGIEVYNYIVSFSEELVVALDLPEYKHKSKQFIMEEIRRRREPIFIEDLVIDENDLLQQGIMNPEEAKEMLHLLVEHTHIKPFDNKREVLLRLAVKFYKNPVRRAFRKVNWIK